MVQVANCPSSFVGACVNSADKVPSSGATVDASSVSGKREGKMQQQCASSVTGAGGKGDSYQNGSKSVCRKTGPSGIPQAVSNSPETLWPKCRSDESKEPSPGVGGFHGNLRKSQGAKPQKSEALQSLILSLPMQETDLRKH